MNSKNLLQNVYRKFFQKMSFGYGFGKNPLIKKILKNVEKQIKTEFTEVQGSKMFLDPGDSLNLSINGVYGELDTKIIREEIHEGDIVIDVGANIGLLGHRLSQRYKDIKIIALEPIPSIFEVLEENCKLSLNNKYKIFPYGVSNKNESKEIIYYPNSTPMSTFNPELWENDQLLIALTDTMNSAPKIWWWVKYVPIFFYPMIVGWLKRGSKNIICELKTLSYIIEKNSLKSINLNN